MTDARPRLFRLQRDIDHTGVSGTGHVADGVVWPDGTATLRWFGKHASTVNWDSLDDAKAVHGHDGATKFVFDLMGPGPADWTGAWSELAGFVEEAVDDGGTIDATHMQAYMQELKRKALAPGRQWIDSILGGSDA